MDPNHSDSSPTESGLPPISSLIRVEAKSHHTINGSVNPDQSSLSIHASTKWLCLQTLQYRYTHDSEGTYPRKWDVAVRTTRDASAIADAVVVLARLRHADDIPRVLLVKQFRPPLNAVSVELPAGLIDKGESLKEAALRELREETGYSGRVTHIHPPASLSPGIAGEQVVLVEVEIEGNARKQNLDAGESIEVISVPFDRLQHALDFMVKQEGVVVMHAVSALAVGIQFATRTDDFR